MRVVEMDPCKPRRRGLGLGASCCRLRCRGLGLGARCSGPRTWRAGARCHASGTRCRGPTHNPIVRGREDLLGRPLNDFQVRSAAEHPIVVQLETGVETKTSVEDEGADERRGRVARLLQCASQRGMRTVETERTIVADTVGERISPGHDRHVRRQRQRHVRAGNLVAQPFGGHVIQRRRDSKRAAVRTNTVRPERVDRDEEHVCASQDSCGRRRDLARPASAAGDSHTRQEHDRCASHAYHYTTL